MIRDFVLYFWSILFYSCKSTPTVSNDCPWALFTVIAKQSQIGNCFWCKIYGNSSSVVVKIIRGINLVWPSNSPPIIWPSNKYREIWINCKWVPLHSSCLGLKFLNKITRAPSLRFKSNRGSDPVSNICKYSNDRKVPDFSSMWSTDSICCVSPSKSFKIVLFNSDTISFCKDNTHQFAKNLKSKCACCIASGGNTWSTNAFIVWNCLI